MPIVIKKRLGPKPIAPLAEGALVAAEPVKAKPVLDTPEEAIKRWKRDVPPPDAKPKLCPFCERPYIRPCRQDEHEGCLNWQFLQKKTVA